MSASQSIPSAAAPPSASAHHFSRRCVPDADIALSVDALLRAMGGLPRDAVQVVVLDGWLSLSGALQRDYQHDALVGGLRRLPGVRGVTSCILVAPDETAGSAADGAAEPVVWLPFPYAN